MARRQINVDRINEEASRLLHGWDADDLIAYNGDQWADIKWRKFHATMYHYKIVRDQQRGTCVIDLWVAHDHSIKVYVSDRWEAFISTMREAMFSLIDSNRIAPHWSSEGVAYIAMSGLPGRRRRWTIPLYDEDLFTPRA